MKEIAISVEDPIAHAFFAFCQRIDIEPTALLSVIVALYGRSEILNRKAEQQELMREEALLETGRIVTDLQSLAKANREFKKVIGQILEPHGISIEELGII